MPKPWERDYAASPGPPWTHNFDQPPAPKEGDPVDWPKVGESVAWGVGQPMAKLGRGLITTALPKAAEKWLEKNHALITPEQLDEYGKVAESTIPGQATKLATEVGTELLPATKFVSGPALLAKAMAMGAGWEGMQAEEGEVLNKVVAGGAAGLVGEAGGQLLLKTLANAVPASEGATELIKRDIVPTLGQAADQTTKRGKLINTAEELISTMPMSGATIRGPRQQTLDKVMDEATELAAPPGVTPHRMPTNEETIRILEQQAKGQMGDSLAQVNVKVTQAHKDAANARLDQLAKKYGVSDDILEKVKKELEEKVWAGAGSKPEANVLENATQDLMAGNYGAARNNVNVERMLKDLGGDFKSWVNTSATQAGRDLPGIRQSLANVHALQRGTDPSKTGASGPRLMRGVLANDKAVGASDTATRELRDLASDAAGVTDPKSVWSSRNIQGLGAEAGLGAGSFLGLGYTPQLGALGYGAVNRSEILKKLLLGDPKTYDKMSQTIAAPAMMAGPDETIAGWLEALKQQRAEAEAEGDQNAPQ